MLAYVMNWETNSSLANRTQILKVRLVPYRIITSIYVAFATYVFVSLVIYLTNPWITKVFCSGSVPDRTEQFNEDGSNEKSNNGGKIAGRGKRHQRCANRSMTILTVVMSVMVLVHVIMDLWAYSERNKTSVDAQCVRHHVSGLLYVTCALCLYLFLWIRQRAFYAHPVLKHLAKPCLIRLSWSVLATIVLESLSITVLFFLPQISNEHLDDESMPQSNDLVIDYAANGMVPRECGFQRKGVYLGAHLITTVAFLYFQISLQVLFAYPIYHQHGSVQHNRRNGDSRKTKIFSRSISETETSMNPEATDFEQKSPVNDIAQKSAILDGYGKSRRNSESRRSSVGRKNSSEVDQDSNRKLCIRSTPSDLSNNNSVATATRIKQFTCIVDRRKYGRGRRAQLRKYVIRCLCVSVICCVSDIIAFLFSYFAQLHDNIQFDELHSGVSESLVTSLAYNANIIINLLCMLVSYRDWRIRLCPWYYLFMKNKFSATEE